MNSINLTAKPYLIYKRRVILVTMAVILLITSVFSMLSLKDGCDDCLREKLNEIEGSIQLKIRYPFQELEKIKSLYCLKSDVSLARIDGFDEPVYISQFYSNIPSEQINNYTSIGDFYFCGEDYYYGDTLKCKISLAIANQFSLHVGEYIKLSDDNQILYISDIINIGSSQTISIPINLYEKRGRINLYQGEFLFDDYVLLNSNGLKSDNLNMFVYYDTVRIIKSLFSTLSNVFLVVLFLCYFAYIMTFIISNRKYFLIENYLGISKKRLFFEYFIINLVHTALIVVVSLGLIMISSSIIVDNLGKAFSIESLQFVFDGYFFIVISLSLFLLSSLVIFFFFITLAKRGINYVED